MISLSENPGGAPLDSANHFEVVPTKSGVAIKGAPLAYQVLSKEQALNLAAWLLAMTGAEVDDVVRILREIAKK